MQLSTISLLSHFSSVLMYYSLLYSTLNKRTILPVCAFSTSPRISNMLTRSITTNIQNDLLRSVPLHHVVRGQLRYTPDGQRCDDVWKYLCHCQTGNNDIGWVVSLRIERVWDVISVRSGWDREYIPVGTIFVCSKRRSNDLGVACEQNISNERGCAFP